MGNFHYLSIALGVFLLDRVSKLLVVSGYRRGAPILFRDGFFSFKYVRNTGGAFGLFPRKGFIFLIVTLLAIGLIVYLLFFSSLRRDLTNVGLALILGGSVGNLLDRILWGAVIDFIHIWRMPVFNPADVAIVCGSGLIIFVLAGGPKLIAS
ncbi:signal peptidase II [Candidatus Bipolaricaulota bacterium]|nr:signal peptidase II [Candidatus Bipolaricaulota bacterium]MBS3825815.1 signal peptidase II [Candidatus Bipolaricaulota bacterium]